MSRLKELLRVACPSTGNTQQRQEIAWKPAPVADFASVHDVGKYRGARNTAQQAVQQAVQGVQAVAQHVHAAQQELLHVARANPCNTQQTPEIARKPAPMLGLVGVHEAEKDLHQRNTTQQTTSERWLLHYVGREPVEMACSPAMSHDQVLESHPAAIAAEPFAPAKNIQVSEAVILELRQLVAIVANFHRFTVADRKEAWETALRDPVAALACFKALAHEIPGARVQ